MGSEMCIRDRANIISMKSLARVVNCKMIASVGVISTGYMRLAMLVVSYCMFSAASTNKRLSKGGMLISIPLSPVVASVVYSN